MPGANVPEFGLIRLAQASNSRPLLPSVSRCDAESNQRRRGKHPDRSLEETGHSTPEGRAIKAVTAATPVDPTFAEAWYNLGDLLDEQGRSEAAKRFLPHACHNQLTGELINDREHL
jgi:Tetratricopeptide repeat